MGKLVEEKYLYFSNPCRRLSSPTPTLVELSRLPGIRTIREKERLDKCILYIYIYIYIYI